MLLGGALMCKIPAMFAGNYDEVNLIVLPSLTWEKESSSMC